jgi:hypothetical protein
MNDVKLTEAELRDYIIGNLYWLGTAPREQATAWMDDAIATHTQYDGKTAEELGKERWNTVAMRNAAIERAEAAEAKAKELERQFRIQQQNYSELYRAVYGFNGEGTTTEPDLSPCDQARRLHERIAELEAEIERMKEEREQDGMEKDLNT